MPNKLNRTMIDKIGTSLLKYKKTNGMSDVLVLVKAENGDIIVKQYERADDVLVNKQFTINMFEQYNYKKGLFVDTLYGYLNDKHPEYFKSSKMTEKTSMKLAGEILQQANTQDILGTDGFVIEYDNYIGNYEFFLEDMKKLANKIMNEKQGTVKLLGFKKFLYDDGGQNLDEFDNPDEAASSAAGFMDVADGTYWYQKKLNIYMIIKFKRTNDKIRVQYNFVCNTTGKKGYNSAFKFNGLLFIDSNPKEMLATNYSKEVIANSFDVAPDSIDNLNKFIDEQYKEVDFNININNKSEKEFNI